ncbi:hypothetical protein FO519_008556, partial [Halicephalobus sp. NKZ332]
MIKKSIWKYAENGQVSVNVIYISTASFNSNKEIFASEIPVIVVKNRETQIYVDTEGRIYESFQEYKDNNSLPRGLMIYPKNGHYVPNCAELEAMEAPAARPGARVVAVIDGVASLVGITLSLCQGVMILVPGLQLPALAMTAITCGSYFCMGWSLLRTGYAIYDKGSRGESTSREWLLILTSALSLASQSMNTYYTNKIHQVIWNIMQKDNISMYDFFQLSVSTFMFVNVITKPKTMEGLFKKEQVKAVKNIMDSLKSERAKNQAEEMASEYKTMDEKAYFIRNVRQVDDPTMFFEAISKSEATVRCTADGLVVSPECASEIKLHARAYNQIGDYTGKIEEIKKDQIRAVSDKYSEQIPSDQQGEFKKDLENIASKDIKERPEAIKKLFTEKYGIDNVNTNEVQNTMNVRVDKALSEKIKIPEEMSDDAKTDLDNLRKLKAQELKGVEMDENNRREIAELETKCEAHRKEHFFKTSAKHANDVPYMEESNRIERELGGGKNLEEWKAERANPNSVYSTEDIEGGIRKAQTARDCKLTMDRKILVEKESYPNINGELEKIKWTEDQIKAFKEIQDSAVEFARKIDTFTNAQNERLCYTVHTKHVTSILQNAYETNDLSSITINGKKPFEKMSIGGFDRLNRVLREYKEEGTDLLKGAMKLATDPNFIPSSDVSTSSDFASLAEAIKTHKKSLDETEQSDFISQMAKGEGNKYDTFVKEHNELYDEISKVHPHKEWSSSISMLYHLPKHKREFGDPSASAEEYFGKHSENVFQKNNITSTGYSQDGTMMKRTYTSIFGNRLHVGFTVENGEATLSLYTKIKEWASNGAKLKDFIQNPWPNPSPRDSGWKQVIKAAKGINSDDFVEREALEGILEELLKKPRYEVNGNKIKIIGRMIFFSEEITRIEHNLKVNSTVKIFAQDCCNLDNTSVKWEGTNLVIVTNKISITDKVTIDVSGKSYIPGKTKANRSTDVKYPGDNGKSGAPGESSGSVTIFTKDFINPELLTIIAKGGRGQDGEDGGDGCDGKDGVGVTRSEIENEIIPNINNRFKDFSHHENFHPRGWRKKKQNIDGSGWLCTYARKVFEDDHGRVMTYCYGTFKQRWSFFCTYDFYLLIKGTDAISGSQGGENGIGGEGGYAGKVLIADPETGINFSVKIVAEQGKCGENGEIGKSGKLGINGNDMGLLMCSSLNRYFYGEKVKQRLKFSYHYGREPYTRYDGYLSWEEKKSACCISFSTEEIDQTSRKTKAATKNTTRTASSRAVAKESIINEDILAEAEELFGAENTFLTDEKMKNELEILVKEFEKLRDKDIHWYDPESYDKYLTKIKEYGLAKLDPDKQKQELEPTESQINFWNLVLIITEQKQYLNEIISPLKVFVESDEELKVRFGKIPKVESTVKDVENTAELIRIWFTLEEITIFNLIFANITVLENGHSISRDNVQCITVTPQSELINQFLYIRLCYFNQKKFINKKIRKGISLIGNGRLKALFATKIHEYLHTKIEPISEDILYKLILMLQRMTNGTNQLVKYSLGDWIDIAKKQTFSEIESLLEEYGSVGYYLGVLNAKKEFKNEEILLMKTLDNLKVILEKLIGIFTNFIINRDVIADKSYFKCIEQLFIGLNNHPDYKECPGKVLVTDEKTQIDLIDCEENCKWLNEYDKALFNLKSVHLRPTQKLAIMYALETEKDLLEQVNTGEGKSYIIAGIACIRCKTGYKSVDIITSSPVLAKRDVEDLKPIYSAMGISVAHNCDEDLESRKKAYTADIVYGDMARFQRDYLLHTFYKKSILGDRTRVAVIVDEVDNMMLDNGNNMLYLSHNVPGMNLLDSLLIFIQEQVFAPIYNGEKITEDTLRERFDSKKIQQNILEDIFGIFTEEDLLKIAPRLPKDQISSLYKKLIEKKVVDTESYLNIYKEDELSKIDEAWKIMGENFRNIVKSCFSIIFQREKKIQLPNYLRSFVKLHLDTLIENCKIAFFMKPNTEYVVDVDRTGTMSSCEPLVTIIDGNTGADLPTSQWSDGLHQFLQLKHGCRLSAITLKAVFISNVAYLQGYEKINGLSGTLGSIHESKTLIDLYDADLIKIPTPKPKYFYEHVPVMNTNKDEWVKNIYDKICDQVSAERSILVICENIEQLKIIIVGLKRNFEKEDQSEELRRCFDNMIIYEREHDEFEFESKKLEPRRLIVATNLAGRGTDIKLSKELIRNGGLHVITAFLPRNCRIEEQAFGRAGRSGDPGSAQIIGLQTESENPYMKPSIFMLKTLRDNEEVYRLKKLKQYYDFHTDIEEKCLEKFKNHCEQALGAVSSQSKTADFLPTSEQIQYFSLLNQWALWLDSMNLQIKQCSKEKNTKSKEEIINAVDNFIKEHPIGEYKEYSTWLTSPQALLSIGINFLHHEDGLKDADIIFDRVINEEPEFAAEAHYYQGIIRTTNFSGTISQKLNEFNFKNLRLSSDLEKAKEHLLKARTLTLLRIGRREREAKIASQLVVKEGIPAVENSGFLEQNKTIIQYLYLMIKNIDYLLGTPCEPNMFMQGKITEKQSKEIYNSLYLQVLNKDILSKKIPLSTRGGFWGQMEAMSAFYNSQVILVVNNKVNEKIPEFFKELETVDISGEKKTPFFIRFSNSTSINEEMYYLRNVEDIIGNNDERKDEVNRLITCGYLKLDKIARVNVFAFKELGYFDRFDGVTKEELKEYIKIEKDSAEWILDLLTERGIFKLQTIPMKKFDQEHNVWKEIEDFIAYENEKQQDPNCELEKKENPLEEPFKRYYSNLLNLKENDDIVNLTTPVVAYYCGLAFNSEDGEKFFKYLENKKIIIPYDYEIYRLATKIDLSCLPSCISLQIDEFFSDRFAFTFALDGLANAIDKSMEGEPAILEVFLPENPLIDFKQDLISLGFAVNSRIFTNDIECIDYEEIGNEEIVKQIVMTNRCKLYDQTDYHLRLKPFGMHALGEGFVLDTEMRNMIDNGMQVVLSLKTERDAWSLGSQIFKCGIKIFNAVKSAVKVVMDFGGKVVYTVTNFIKEKIGTISEFTSATTSFIREAMMKFSPKLVEVYDNAKRLVFKAGMKVLEKVEWTMEKRKQAANWANENIIDPVWTGVKKGIKWVSDHTTLTYTLNTIVSFVKEIFGRVNRFCTAMIESYEYYNQLRTATRRAALDHRFEISEHTILRAYHENRVEQKKEIEKIEELNESIPMELAILRTSLWEIYSRLIKIKPPVMNKNILKKCLLDVFENGRGMKYFKSEFKDVLTVITWVMQCQTQANINGENFNSNIKNEINSFERILVYYIEIFFDELKELVSDANYESDKEEVLKDWLSSFHKLLKEYINETIETTCIGPSSKILYGLFNGAGNSIFMESNEDDAVLKKAISNDHFENKTQTKVLFLRKELITFVFDRIRYSPNNKKLLKHAIKYGYPLPLEVMKTVADAIEIAITEAQFYKSGFVLIVTSEEKEVINYKTKSSGKMKISLEAHGGKLYLCQKDFQENTGLPGTEEGKKLPFIFEAYIGTFKHLTPKFAKKEETMR